PRSDDCAPAPVPRSRLRPLLQRAPRSAVRPRARNSVPVLPRVSIGSMHSHDHPHSHGTRAFAIVTLVNLAYTVLEAGYGFATNSLALISDALHNLGDVLGLALAWGAALIARRAPTGRHTYGWRRATLLSPLANAALLVAFSGALAWEAVRRFSEPPEIPGLPVIIVA